MSWFAILLMAVAAGFVTSNGARAQLLVAWLARELGRSQSLLLSALFISSATMLLAAWLGSQARLHLGDEEVGWLTVLAMLGASVELLWPMRMRAASEPTRSFGAISLVLAGRQSIDAPRLVILAAGMQLGPASLLGVGGAIGAGISLWFGWRFGEIVQRQASVDALRWIIGLILLVLALLLGAENLR
jgi:hypothetical protein